MGLFGSRKKTQVQDISNDFGQGLGVQGLGQVGFNDMNSGGFGGQDFEQPNSGLKLADLNNQEAAGMGTPQGGLDSFGNPRPQQRVENYEYRQNVQSMQDNSKDLQIIIAKLDAIRSEITNINHRLDNIERTQKETPQKKYPW